MDSLRERSRAAVTSVLRQARRAWHLQFHDTRRASALAEKALARALESGDRGAEGWARLTRALQRIRFGTPAEAVSELDLARECFDAVGDEAGRILAATFVARCIWLEGRSTEALAVVQPLRDRGLRVLAREERSMLLNVIAGCHSTLGQSAQAFAYMYQALRETGAARRHGYEVVLYNNIAHELCQLGDLGEALRYIEEGITRCAQVENPRILGTLLANRITCLTELDRTTEALADVHRLLAIPADASGRGTTGAQFETMAIAALRAREPALGADLVERARRALTDAASPDERIELAVASAELLRAQGDPSAAIEQMAQVAQLASGEGADGPSLRARCLLFRALADMQEQVGERAQALASLRAWQRYYSERARLASQARYQAASLQTELLRLQLERDDIEARRRSTERAKADLEASNRQLSQKISEVQSLQTALREQAVRDFLTGLFNRRYLNEMLPSLFALSERDGVPLSVAIVDLDHFKAINDQHGHAAGDTVLAAFGELLGQRLRKSDVACRYGGEEFCVLLPNTDAAAARRKLAGLQEAWRAKVFTFQSGVVSGCTFSAGIADSRCVPDSAQVLVRVADDCELEAKRLGRRRIVVFYPAAPEGAGR